MDTAAWISIMSLLMVNIGVVSFSYGKLSQKVSDLARRLDRLEKSMNCGEKK